MRPNVERDCELIRALSSEHGERALEQILHNHGPMVMGVCRRVLGDRHEAEDAFQATFIVLVRKRQSLTLTKSLGGWLQAVAFHAAIKAKAMNSEQRTAVRLLDADVPSREPDQTERVAWAEIGKILDDEVRQLPEMLRAVVVLCDLEGRSHKEAAAELGVPPGTVSGRLIRARERLRLRLTRRGVAITTVGLTAAMATHASATVLTASQFDGALKTGTLVLCGKAAALTTSATLALVLANAASRNTFLAKTLAASAKGAVVLLAVVAVGVFLMSPASDAKVDAVPYLDPLIAADRAVMHLGEETFRHRTGASRVAYSADGKMLVTLSPDSRDSGIYIWDVATGRKLGEFHVTDSMKNWPIRLAVSPSGNMIGIGRSNGEVSVLDGNTGVLTFVERPDKRPVTAIAFSPDGKRLITSNMDGVVRVSMPDDFGRKLWKRSVIPAQPPNVKSSHDAHASVIAVSPDGARLALADGAVGTIYLLDANSGDLLQTIEQAHSPPLWAHAGSIQTLAFIHGGRQLISGGHRTVLRENTTFKSVVDDRVHLLEARLWDVPTGALVQDLVDVEIRGFGCLAVSKDGKNFVTNDYDALHFWRAGDGAPEFEVPLPGSNISSLASSPDGSTVAIPTGKGITFWDAQTAQRKFHAEKPRYSELNCVSWANRSDVLAIGYQDGFELWNAATGELQQRFELSDPGVQYAFPPSVTQAAISADGQLAACIGEFILPPWEIYGFIQIWDTASGAKRVNIAMGRSMSSMALADDASVVAVTTSYGWHRDGQLRVYDLSGGLISRFPDDFEVMPNVELPGFPRVKASQIITGSTKIILVCEDGYCFQWDYKLHRKSGEFFANQQTDENAGEVRSAVFSPDGKTLVTSGRHKLCVWNTETGALEHMELVPMSEQWLNLGISRDGRFLVGAESYFDMHRLDDTIRIWDLRSRTLRSMWKVPNARATSFTFSPDNKRLLTGLDRGTAVIWDLSDAQLERTLK